MKYELNNVYYDVIIQRKSNKNLYIRVKEDMKIYVSCNYLFTKHQIKNILDKNSDSLQRMINNVNKNKRDASKLFYLGDVYDIIFLDDAREVIMSDNKVYARDLNMLNKWYKEETIRIFDERYVYNFNRFKENIKSPILKIRTMKTRWGVYNRKNHTITLNSKLIEFDVRKIDYVIIHELSHIIHFNHSRDFWNLVSKYCSDYKLIRKEINNK